MKKLIAALCFTGALFATCVQAQTPAAPEPAALAAANEMLASMNYRQMATGIFSQMRQAMPAMMKQGATAAINNDTRLDAAKKQEALARLDGELSKANAAMDGIFNDPAILDQVMQNTAAIYARHYTASEMHQIAAFYKTPVGMKMLATMPQMMAESIKATQDTVMPRMSEIMKSLQKAP